MEYQITCLPTIPKEEKKRQKTNQQVILTANPSKKIKKIFIIQQIEVKNYFVIYSKKAVFFKENPPEKMNYYKKKKNLTFPQTWTSSLCFPCSVTYAENPANRSTGFIRERRGQKDLVPKKRKHSVASNPTT